MKTLAVMLFTAAFAVSFADVTATCGWEGTDTVLGTYGGMQATIETVDPIHEGSQSLELEQTAGSDGNTQAYVAWITGLTDGDQVTASIWRYDDTPGAAPSGRIWAHWNDDPNDVTGYNGSAGGNSDYGEGLGWDMTEHSWEVVDGHTGLVIEFRVYSAPGDIVWVDDLTVTAPDGSGIIVPDYAQSLDSSTWATIKAIF
ncbi:hypothetical protein CSA37_12730 [Candidatus Fermentibacteria bacterium]|nr:MAG: hypothetical protein CSA37_12730 [Candidatus Fermentibacteria bacterium]